MVANNSAGDRLKKKTVKVNPEASDPWSAPMDCLHPLGQTEEAELIWRAWRLKRRKGTWTAMIARTAMMSMASLLSHLLSTSLGRGI